MQIRAIGGWIKGDAGYYIRFCDLIIPPIEEEEVVTEEPDFPPVVLPPGTGDNWVDNPPVTIPIEANPLDQHGPVWWYHSDHLGSTSYITDIFGKPVQYIEYLPFGEVMVEQSTNNILENVYKFNSKELDAQTGYYYYGARYYDPGTSVFLSVDPLADQFPGWNPYHYVHNNPINLIDPTGMAAEMLDGPGDEFKSRDLAAKDFGEYYNGTSIIKNKEISSTIYSYEREGETYYSYNDGYIGRESSTKKGGHGNPSGTTKEALIHTHAGYDENYKSNEFSNRDKWNAYDDKVDSYVATPNGSLLKYDYKTTEVSVISTDLQSDPKDPMRMNNNQPKLNIYNKAETATQKKEMYKNSFQYFGFQSK